MKTLFKILSSDAVHILTWTALAINVLILIVAGHLHAIIGWLVAMTFFAAVWIKETEGKHKQKNVLKKK